MGESELRGRRDVFVQSVCSGKYRFLTAIQCFWSSNRTEYAAGIPISPPHSIPSPPPLCLSVQPEKSERISR
ncbi:hypothetical protein JTE90_025193 [Oedothorax gibbosus]|uniref:Peptide-methionine (S)-S-oxide reductase n=1 Tax=Oedothorax gibbosus TaxID=931172 RepID=A0AAV6UBH1_9ARAC|nr:hypothetical protein JTE90_025193 [Oedothorax gibbosus]